MCCFISCRRSGRSNLSATYPLLSSFEYSTSIVPGADVPPVSSNSQDIVCLPWGLGNDFSLKLPTYLKTQRYRRNPMVKALPHLFGSTLCEFHYRGVENNGRSPAARSNSSSIIHPISTFADMTAKLIQWGNTRGAH